MAWWVRHLKAAWLAPRGSGPKQTYIHIHSYLMDHLPPTPPQQAAGQSLPSYQRECRQWAFSLNQIQRECSFAQLELLRELAQLARREVPSIVQEPQRALALAAAHIRTRVQSAPTPLRNIP